MMLVRSFIVNLFIAVVLVCIVSCKKRPKPEPSVLVVLLARNKAHTLPYFLSYFRELDYPKDRMILHIRADHCQDATINILKDWIKEYRPLYYMVDDQLEDSPAVYKGETSRWKTSHYNLDNVMKLKENALKVAKLFHTEYIWYLDMDVFITNNKTLKAMIETDRAIVAPMLNSLEQYSNFWTAIDASFESIRDEEYEDIISRKMKSCFQVPLVKESVLINLQKVNIDSIAFHPESIDEYEAPFNDNIVFSFSAEGEGTPIYVCNQEIYGYVMPDSSITQVETFDNYKNLKVLIIGENGSLEIDDILLKYLPQTSTKSKRNFDQIYYINLERREDRRTRMENMLEILGIDGKRMEGVDGLALNFSSLISMGVKPIPAYRDILTERPMTYGEVGCFLSHYKIWQDILENGHKEVSMQSNYLTIVKE